MLTAHGEFEPSVCSLDHGFTEFVVIGVVIIIVTTDAIMGEVSDVDETYGYFEH